MLSLAAIVAMATGASVYYYDYTRAGEELTKWAKNMGSKPLLSKQKGGHTWTPVSKLREKFAVEETMFSSKSDEKDFLGSFFSSLLNKNKVTTEKPHYERKNIFIDEFRYFPKTVSKCSPFFLGKKAMEKTRIHFSSIDIRNGLLVIGPMGSGKSEFFFNLVFQPWYKRALIHDIKGSDFGPVLCDNKRGFVLNLYNKSAAIWDLMSEKNFLLMIGPVSLDLMIGASGESKDPFFANSAADRIKTMFEKAFLQGGESEQKWQRLEEEIAAWEAVVKSPNSKENKDVYNNFLLVRETLLFWSYRIKNAAKTFTISQFQQSNYQLIMNGAEQTIKGYYSAFVSALADEALRGPDQKGNGTLLLLDEYLTMPLSEDTRLKLHTMCRSKDYSLIVGAQFLPQDDTLKKQVIDSSRFAAVLFNIQDEATTAHFKRFYGEVKYKEAEVSTSRNKHDYVTGVSTSSQERTASFLGEEELQRKPPYHHLTILASGEAYLGYTPQIKTKKIYDPLSDIFDIAPFKAKMRGFEVSKPSE